MPTSLVSPTAAWALLYGQAGWRSFPVWPGEKRPMYAGWQKDASTEPELLTRYFADVERNIGIVCGETFDAWDIEIEHVDAFAAWLGTNDHRLPEAPIASTGRGGIHVLTKPTGVDGTRRLHLDGKHIGELKSRGGFIVVAPSETESQYRWLHLPERLALPEAPEWLCGLLERPASVTRRFVSRLASPDDVVEVLGRLAGSVEHSPEGRRNNYLYWAMRRAIEEGIPPATAARVLTIAAEEAGLPRHETEQTIQSACDAESVAA